MLGVLCARPKPWILNSFTHFHSFSPAHNNRHVESPSHFSDSSISSRLRHHHSTSCRFVGSSGGAAASIWHLIQPSGFKNRRSSGHVRRMLAEPRGEGSWNVAWDARPARWLHRPDSAWLLFGVCACLAPIGLLADETAVLPGDKTEGSDSSGGLNSGLDDDRSDFKVTGVLADGRCLFRAIAHVACLRNGEEAPDETRQRELADELRAQVVNELLTRREESEWFIEGDFDTYVKRIEKPYVWGGEPELLMASHVLKTMISVFMIDRTSGNLVNIANYGEEYQKEEVSPIKVLFHGYGHYDILETLGQNYQKVCA
ncbi:OVARIAN TUMOR DOMAIN-containing deubiquitinating enzyme 4 [Euphorbia peplus]|nr:OVARIAN TUMOR DOMAIN-containing deubiquitinating enzyme 4 [Euphorbia peplus]